MALYLKIFVRPYSIIMPNFKFLSQNAQFPQILRIPLPLIATFIKTYQGVVINVYGGVRGGKRNR